MNTQLNILLTTKLLETCGNDSSAAIYSILPEIDKKSEELKGIYAHSINNIPTIIDEAVASFSDKRNKNPSKIINKEEIINTFTKSIFSEKNIKIPNNKTLAALGMMSHIYFDTFINPVQFFLPHSSACSGQWDLWNMIDYIKLKKELNNKQFVFELRKRLQENSIWNIKFNLEDFPPIIQRRLQKEHLLNKKLDPESLIKAMIIRLGEIAKPDINYEIIDYLIRSFFTYLNTKKYLRIDREILFLRNLEEEIKKIIKESI